MDSFTEYTKEQLATAFQNEYEYLIHDDFDPDEDMSSDEHLEWTNTLSADELRVEIKESIDTENCCSEDVDKISFNDYMERWLNLWLLSEYSVRWLLM